MIELRQLEHTYADLPIRYPDWQVEDQGHALILGTSGSGKTTLLHLICGLLKPTAGEILFNGQSFAGLSTKKRDRFRGEHIGIVFQRPHLVKSLTVLENLKLAAYLSGKKVSSDKYLHVLEALQLGDLKKRKAHELSEGQAQRVSIARAVIHDPILLAADEPTASLDDANCSRVLHLLKQQASDRNATLLIATHDHRIKSSFTNQLVL